MNRAHRVAAAIALVGVLCAPALAPAPTDATWVDQEVAGDTTLRAGTVNPPTGLRCTGGLLQPVTFTWTAPAGGLPRTEYRWTVTGNLTGSGTLAASATSVTLTSLAILSVGSGTFSLYAVGPGGWNSTTVTGSLFAVSVIGLGVVASCSA